MFSYLRLSGSGVSECGYLVVNWRLILQSIPRTLYYMLQSARDPTAMEESEPPARLYDEPTRLIEGNGGRMSADVMRAPSSS